LALLTSHDLVIFQANDDIKLRSVKAVTYGQAIVRD